MIDLGISLGDQETDVLMSENNDSQDESRVVDGPYHRDDNRGNNLNE